MARIYLTAPALAAWPHKTTVRRVEENLFRVSLSWKLWMELQGEREPQETVSETVLRIYKKEESNENRIDD